MGEESTQLESIGRIERKKTEEVRVGNLLIGGNNPIVIQEMTTTYTADRDATVKQIHQLEQAGCRLIRVAVPDTASAAALKSIKEQINIPVIADIHFNYKLALLSIENGVDKLRLNPGNIGGSKNVSAVVSAARERGVPIRIGVNSGSLDKDILRKYGGITAKGMVESALREVSLLEKQNFHDTIISLKSSDIAMTVEANKILSKRVNYPLHIGITESGYGEVGLMRSAAGLGTLLFNGIGDTVRISLMNLDRVENIRACFALLDRLRIPYV